MEITAIILVGGLGTRLKSTVPNLPKPMAPIAGRPFLEYQMDYWIKQGVCRFILSVGHLKDIIINHFSDKYCGVPIEYSDEESPLGTGGAFLKASKNLEETFLVLNGDTFIEVDLHEMVKFHVKNKSDWTLSVIEKTSSNRYMGVEMKNDGRIVSLESSNSNLVNGGVYLINPSVAKRLNIMENTKVSLENELLPSFISKKGSLYGIKCNGRFIDIGVSDDYFRAEELLINA